MIKVFNRQRDLEAVLENAFNIQEQQVLNGIGYLEFSLPLPDTKNEYCKPFHYVRFSAGDLYRIMSNGKTVTETGDIRYRCEHVLATLIGTIMPDENERLNWTTRRVIEWILAWQRPDERHWVLGECDFERLFSYAWTDETLLSALFSVPNRFDVPFIWTFDTSSYPWVISLKALDVTQVPSLFVRVGLNALTLSDEVDATTVVTRLYPRGYGESINTLKITNVNPTGKEYLESPQHILDEYGIVEDTWRDKRYTNEQSLFEAAQAMLTELQTPFIKYDVDFAFLQKDEYNQPKVGGIVEIVGEVRTFITQIKWVHDEIPLSQLTIANKPRDVSSTLAQMRDRVRIGERYTNGSPQVYAYSDRGKADSQNPLHLDFFIPRQMENVHSVDIRIRTERLRSDFRATGGGGEMAETLLPQDVQTNGQPIWNRNYTATSEILEPTNINIPPNDWAFSNAVHNHGFLAGQRAVHTWEHDGAGGIRVLSLSGNFTPSGAHRHLGHQHTTGIPAHTHPFSLPPHTHDMTPGITFHHTAPTSYMLLVNGVSRGTFNISRETFEIKEWLFDENREIRRGTWHTVSILPNNHSSIVMAAAVQGFIHS